MAFDAVNGVLGVLCPYRRGGVVSSESDVFPSALTREMVGVLSGSRFSGGRRNGAKFFLFRDDTDAFGSSVWVTLLVVPRVIPRLRLADNDNVGSLVSVKDFMGAISLCLGGSGGIEG